jgi:hypothetical protein
VYVNSCHLSFRFPFTYTLPANASIEHHVRTLPARADRWFPAIHSLTDICFRKCITSKISSGKLDRYEEPCMQNCVDRFMDANYVVLKELEKMRSS